MYVKKYEPNSSQLTAHSSQLTAHSSQLTAHSSQLTLKLKRRFRNFKRQFLVYLLTFSLLLTQFASIFVPSVYAASSPWSQTNWAGGSGQTSWSDTTRFSSSSNVTTSTANQVTLTATSGWCNNSYCNSSWGYRRKVTFNNTDANLGVTSEALSNFPVLVKLTSSNIDYSKTQSAGQDIRFTDSSGNDLAYEIEKWDGTGTSWVWVKVPSISINSSTDYMYMYYGNSSATDHQQATSVWNSNYVGVWHLKETGNGTSGEYKDSVGTNNGQGGNGTATSVPTISTLGQIDGAQSFDGSNDYISIPNNSAFYFINADFTAEMWVNANSWRDPSGHPTILDFEKAGWNGWLIRYSQSTGNNITFGGSGGERTLLASPPSLGSLHYISATYSENGQSLKGYLDGVLSKTTSINLNLTSSSGTSHAIGSNFENLSQSFDGIIDEVRISSVVRSAAYLAASYRSETDAFNTFAAQEQYYQSSGTLTSSIFDSGQGSDWGTLTYAATTPTNTSVSVKVRTGNQSDLSDATAFTSCSAISSGSTAGGTSCATNTQRYVQYQLSLANTDSVSTTTFTSFSLPFSASLPTAPSSLSGSAASTSSITWSWTDNASNESGFYAQDTSGNTKCTVSSASSGTGSTVTCTEGSLSPNTSYTRKVVAYNGSGNSTASSNATASTLATAPTTSNVTSSPATSSWTNNSSFTFTNSLGFGAGYVQYFRYAWDTSSTHTWTGSETQWTSSTLTKTATSDSNSWYLHLKGYNSSDVENGTLDLGPYYYDGTAPNSFDLDSPGDNSYTTSDRPTFKWKAATTGDATSGLQKYRLEIDNGDTGDFTVDNIPVSRTTDYETNKYLIHYENFSDSDNSNNYISVYTKHSTDWGQTSDNENDGKLKEGKRTWKIVAVDNAGNSKDASRTLYVDFTAPAITLSKIGSLDFDTKYDNWYYTQLKPTLSGKSSEQGTVNIVFDKKGFNTGILGGYGNFITANVNTDSSGNFSWTPELEYGQYQVTIKAKDQAGNTSSEIKFNLDVDSYDNLVSQGIIKTTPAKSTSTLTPKSTSEESPSVPPSEVSPAPKEGGPIIPPEPNVIQKVGTGIVKTSQNIFSGTVNLIGGIFNGVSKVSVSIAQGVGNGTKVGFNTVDSGLAFTGEKISSGLGFAFNTTGKGLAFIGHEIQSGLSAVGQGLAFAGQKTGQALVFVGTQIGNGVSNIASATGSGLAFTSSAIAQGYNNLADNAPGVAKTVLIGFRNGATAVGEGIADTTGVIASTTVNITKGTASVVGNVSGVIATTTVNTTRSIAQTVANTTTGITNATSKTIASIAQSTSNTISSTSKAVSSSVKIATSSVSNSLLRVTNKTKEGIAQLAFNVGERTQDVSDSLGFTIVKLGYLFVNEPTTISDVKVAKLDTTTARITWTTNHPATSKVNYGLTQDFGQDIQSQKRVTQHEIVITGLKPNTQYFYEVMSQNKNYVFDANHTFTTPDDKSKEEKTKEKPTKSTKLNINQKIKK